MIKKSKEAMPWIRKCILFLYCVYALVLFIALMLLVFPFVALAACWGKARGGDVIYRICRIWADGWLLGVGMRCTMLGPVMPDPDRQYIFIANHISYLDIPLILKSIRRHNIRVLGKHEMKYWPIFGFIYSKAAIMVDRSDPDQRSQSVRALKSALARGVSIFIYPEGTFNETHRPLKSFFDGAFRIAIETQTPLKPLLFLDGYDRMHYRSIFSLNPGRLRTVCLEEIPVKGLTMTDLGKLKQTVFHRMESALLDYKASWINDRA